MLITDIPRPDVTGISGIAGRAPHRLERYASGRLPGEFQDVAIGAVTERRREVVTHLPIGLKDDERPSLDDGLPAVAR